MQLAYPQHASNHAINIAGFDWEEVWRGIALQTSSALLGKSDILNGTGLAVTAMAATTTGIAFVVAFVLGCRICVLGAERVAAAAARDRVGIVDLERAGQHIILLIVDRGAAQIARADRIDHQAQAMGVPVGVAIA